MPEKTNPYDPIPPLSGNPSSLEAWLTSADQSFLLQRQANSLHFTDNANDFPVITVNAEQKYQIMEGFGFSLTGGSAMLISRLPAPDRAALLRELFLPDGDGIGISFLRLSIGSSDLSERCFTYNDRPDGQSDPELAHFDIEAGDLEVIPLLREILTINAEIRIMATAWSAPTWMKTNQSFVGGKLRPDCYAVYAAYLVKYLQAMRQKDITVHAITPQNEPLNLKNEPSMIMEAGEQAEFIKNHLGPALSAAGLDYVELFCWDHNCDVKEYPLTVFADAYARRYLTGSAWHLYGGDISTLSEVHRLYPEMKLYFTEQWVGSDGQFGGDLMWHVKNVLIGSTRNWSQVVLEWNLASDPFCCPHTPGGEARCVGALTIDGTVVRNVAYYVIAHAAKFIRPGSVRIYSDEQASLPDAAFLTPEGYIVLIVLNDAAEPRSFSIRFQGKNAVAVLPPNAVATYVWRVK
jgi:glucosylceramidase